MATYKKASKKVELESKLQQLDALGANASDFLQEETFNVIEEVVSEFVGRVQANIEGEPNLINTGKIADIEVKVEGDEVNVYAYPYLLYQDLGVNGAINKLYNTPYSYKNKIPPIEDIKIWIKQRNLSSINNPKYYGETEFENLTEEQKITKAAWGISKKIYRDGISPKNIYSKEIPKLLEDLDNVIGDFAAQTTVIVIEIPKDK